MTRVVLAPMAGTPEDVGVLQRVLERAPGYAHRVTGAPPAPTVAAELFAALPPGVGREAKHVHGIVADAHTIGCADLVRGWPEAGTAHIGLLLLAEEHAGRGLGRAAFEAVEDRVRQWPEVHRLRAGVVATNDVVLPFWRAMGLVETGETTPYQRGAVTSHVTMVAKRYAPAGAAEPRGQ